jgi:hypothetical protein
MTFRININTLEKAEVSNNLGNHFFSSDWRDCTLEEENNFYLEKYTKQKLNELNNIKLLQQVANFSYTNSNGTYELYNSEKSKNKIVGRNQVWKEGVTSKVWISAAGESIEFTKEDYDNIIDLIESKEEVIYTKEAIIVGQIKAITDYAELESFDVQGAWDSL